VSNNVIAGAAPYFPGEDRLALLPLIDEILRSGKLTQGPHLRAFEQCCAEMAGTRHALAVNSGGTALQLVLEALPVAGGEVIVPTQTFVATPNSVVRAGGTPVFVDVSAENLAIDVVSLQRAMTPRTRAVIVVHMFGIMSRQLDEVRRICRDAGVFLIEDAAHAHGATYNGESAGSLGSAACFSYYATKILSVGEGGAVTTNDERLAASVESLRDHGRASTGDVFDRAGNNFRLPEIPALLGTFQHRRLQEIIAHRRAIAGVYRQVFATMPGVVRVIDPEPRDGHVYWRYPVLLERSVDRRRVQVRMADEARCRVTWMYEPLCHRQPYYARADAAGRFPVAEDTIARLLNFPTHPGVALEDAVRIADAFGRIARAEMAA
jgi:perosamine synthetase